MQEQWVPVDGFEKYEVSSLGRVRSLGIEGRTGRFKNGTMLKAGEQSPGWYRAATLYDSNKVPHVFLVHRLVARAFLGESSLFVNHKNGIKGDNRVENLEYATQKENMLHAYRIGLIKKGSTSLPGEKNGMSRVTDAEAVKISEMLWLKMGVTEIARMLGIKRHVINAIKHGYGWKHIPREFKWQPIVLAPLVNS